MNYYSHHIGDYLSATAHLTLLEHGAYRRMIDVYYIHESALPPDRKQVYRLVGARTKEEREAVDSILAEFFIESEEGWIQSRCDHEISLCNKNRENGKKGGRPSGSGNPKKTQTKPEQEPKENPNETQSKSPPSPHHPITLSPELSISEQTTSTTNTARAVASVSSSSSPDLQARGKALAARLAKLESARTGKQVRSSHGHPCLAAWVNAGITDSQFREAYDIAVMERIEAGDASPVNVGFLDVFVGKVMNPGDAPSSVSGAIKAWHETASGIESKGKELGIPPPSAATGGFPAFKARVFKAAGMAIEAAA